MKEIRFGIIGCGLMGREFASATSRWHHIDEIGVRPVITGLCDVNREAMTWFERNVPTVAFSTTDYRELLARADIDAVYCAVPHHLHEQFYTDIIRAGKHLLGEKPFGIDREANRRILEVVDEHPDVLVRCASEMPYFPPAIRIIEAIREGRFGRIIEVQTGLLKSSDLNPNKAINWKRRLEFNGEYGCMGDLGMHALHIPLRFGWVPDAPTAVLSNIMTQRPDGKGGRAACETWDNATIFGAVESQEGAFPLIVETKRIAPGESSTWYIRVHGTRRSMEYSTKYPKTLRVMDYEPDAEQAWQHIDVAYESAYPAITASSLEFGFPDAILQMWAAFCDELVHGQDGMYQPFYCVTPEESALQHDILTSALASHAESVSA